MPIILQQFGGGNQIQRGTSICPLWIRILATPVGKFALEPYFDEQAMDVAGSPIKYWEGIVRARAGISTASKLAQGIHGIDRLCAHGLVNELRTNLFSISASGSHLGTKFLVIGSADGREYTAVLFIGRAVVRLSPVLLCLS